VQKSPGHLPRVTEDVVTVMPVTPLSDDPRSILYIADTHIPLRYVTQMEGHGRNIFIPFRQHARASTFALLRLFFSRPQEIYISSN